MLALDSPFQSWLSVSQSSSVEQLQVGDGYFASLVATLAHQPVRVHARDTAHGDDLETEGGAP